MNIWNYVVDKVEGMLKSHAFILLKVTQRDDKSLFIEVDKSDNLTDEMLDDIINSFQKSRIK